MVRKEIPYYMYANEQNPDGTTMVELFTSEEDTIPDVSYIHGFAGVTIRSHEPGWGSIPINGRERLKTVRDSLIEACKHFGIE